MRRIQDLLNIIHYCFYKADSKRHLVFNTLNPFMLIGRIPGIKRKFEEQNTTHSQLVDNLWTDKRFGFSIIIANAGIVLVLFGGIWSIFLIVNRVLKEPFGVSWISLFICMLLAYIISYVAIFMKNKYIKYFAQFEKWTNREKQIYALFSFVCIVTSVVFFIYTFRFLPKS